MSRARRIADGLLVGLFLTVVGAGATATWATVATGNPAPGGRAVTSWRTAPAWVEERFAAGLAARATLTRWHNQLKVFWLRSSPSPKVWLGRGGWLYFDQSAEGKSLSPHDPALPARLDRWAAVLSARRVWLAGQGVRFLAVVVPEKQSVYPEHLPGAARQFGPTPLDEFLADCRRDPDLTVLDLRGPLAAAKQSEPVYLRTDTHWNQAGIYAGYAATVRALALEPLPREAFAIRRGRTAAGDLTRLLGLTGRLAEEYPQWEWRSPPQARAVAAQPAGAGALAHVRPRAWERDDPALPRVVLLGDSFTGDLYGELLAEHCARLVQVGTYHGAEDLIDRERPDVVICQFAERILQAPPPPLSAAYPPSIPTLRAYGKRPPAAMIGPTSPSGLSGHDSPVVRLCSVPEAVSISNSSPVQTRSQSRSADSNGTR
jgi:hypothetical protein